MKHEALDKWVSEAARDCQPDEVIWIDGSEEEKRRLTEEAIGSGEIVELDQNKWPGCYYHRSALNDVARVENLTFICTSHKEDAGPNNNWMSPADGYARAGEIFKGSMKGRKMYVIPFSLGPVGSPYSKIGVQVTDSIYVVLSMRIMTKVGSSVLEALGSDGEFTKCRHGKADLNIDRRLILHFPEDNAIWSVGSGYGGNVLLGKKCMALRIASHLARSEGWLAEHMLILTVKRPDGSKAHIAAAFPSACGKTNLAMLIPPKHFLDQGYEVTTVGDDIAWIRPNGDGRLCAMNPETGFFGVAPGTSMKTNPNAMIAIHKNTIFTNVALGKDGAVWWEGMDTEPPKEAFDWTGQPWYLGKTDGNGKAIPGANPNSRYTAPLTQCPSFEVGVPEIGVPIDAIVFGGRRARLAPLVYEAYDWAHGAYVGATMASERTAAQAGQVGEVRRDPMAMLPFCGYNMADYFSHWLKVGKKLNQPPKIFHANWFRHDDQGRWLWPGFGENFRVLDWILRRCDGSVDAKETPIGLMPRRSDLDLTGLDVSDADMRELLGIDHDAWLQEAEDSAAYFEQFGDRLPKEMREQNRSLIKRLNV